MRKFFTILLGIALSATVCGQNGFELTPLDIDNISAYTIDEEENYWITSESEGLFKYAEDSLYSIYPDMGFTDVFIDANGVYLVSLNGIYYLHRDDEYTFDTIVSGLTNAAYLSENKLVRAASWSVFDPAIVEIYEDNSLISSDTLSGNYDFNDIMVYQDTLFFAHDDGLLKKAGEEYIEVSDIRTEGIAAWKNQLWTTNGYFYENGKIKEIESYGKSIGVMGDKVWSIAGGKLFFIDYDHIFSYPMPGFYVYYRTKSFANQNGQNKMEFMTLQGLITFNPDDYIADPGFFDANTSRYLSINNVKAMYSTSNSLFWDFMRARYEVPKDSGVSSMYATAPWMGGIDQDGQLRVVKTRFLQEGPQLYPGPLRIEDGTTDTATAAKYHRMWHLDRATIENFKYRAENGQVQNGNWPIHYSIETWPAHGPEGYAENLAPFVDYNNDGVYNPQDGDYPEMKGDEMLFWIINDNLATTNAASLGENMGVELHCTAWANVYENGTNDTAEAINHTTFLDVKVINRSSRNYSDMYLGMWSDFDLGYYADDFVAADVMNHSFYVYNADDYDDTDSPVRGYGDNPPAQSVTFLDAPMKNTTANADTGIYLTNFVSFGNDGSNHGQPEVAADYYNYLKGNWKDSSSVTFGGNGYENSLECDYMFPGDSDPYHIGTDGTDPGSNWTEETAGSTPNDRRGIGANGPFDLNTGESVSFRFAFVWARGDNGAQSSVTRLRELLPMVHEWQRTGNFPSNYNINIVPLGITETTSNNLDVNIYPNPAKQLVNIISEAENAVYTIYNLSGQIVAAGKINGAITTIDISNLSNDLYLVHVNDGNKGFTKKLIVE